MIGWALDAVASADQAVVAGEVSKATQLRRGADQAYVAVLSELTRLSECEAARIEPKFTELEMRLLPHRD